MKQVAIIIGSDSDLPVMQEAANLLESFGIAYDLTIVSAHRSPERLFDFARKAADQFSVIIAGAGGAAHLPGMVAAITPLPVIGVPIKTKSMDGVDSLFSIAQMPAGVPVATVAINGARNAGLLAVQILSVADQKLLEKIAEYKKNLKQEVENKAELLQTAGYSNYLKDKMGIQ
jgi:5-(carboxyamino)imidazole ribonucleotide mutase